MNKTAPRASHVLPLADHLQYGPYAGLGLIIIIFFWWRFF